MLVYQVHRSKYKYRKWIYLVLAVIAFYLLKVLMNTSLGGRMFLGDELMDGSAQARLVFTDYLGEISLVSFPSWVSNTYKSENSFLFILISWGIFIGCFLMYFVIRYFWSNIKPYQREVRYNLLLSSIGIGSLNNNLAGPGLFIWILMYIIVFRNELALNKH